MRKLLSLGTMASASFVYRLVFSFVCSSALISAASAQQLQDPTKPSNMVAQGGEMSGATGEPVLQSVLISPGRRVAVISGQTVKLGGQFGGAKLVRIAEDEVVLRSGNEFQTLKLFQSIGKKRTSDRTNRNPESKSSEIPNRIR